MSFGSKLDELPIAIPPGDEIIVMLSIESNGAEFERHATIYVEEVTGIRSLDITVKTAS
ncbi:MAG: hypothetical protein ACRELG_09485 [Gemmataceae bacterium]